MAFLLTMLAPGAGGEAAAQTRTLKIHFTHTKERGEVTFKRNGRYVQSGLDELNRLLRDWRRNESTKMDPRLFDLLWEVYQASGSRDHIYIVSAYRSPATNEMLRSNSSGVAKKSQHTMGKAIDFFLPDVPVKKVRELGMKFQVGGVGYYPSSGSPFIHLDVGSVRAWPRMSRQELVALFPDGKTLHLPPDGKKLAGYDQALADYKRRVGSSEIAVAGGGSRGSDEGGGGKRRNLIAMLFGNNGDEDEDATAIASSAPQPQQSAPAPARAPASQGNAQPATQVAALPSPENVPIPVRRPVIGNVPPPQVASLAPVGERTPPPGADLATATLPADADRSPVPAPVETAEEPEREEEPQYVDLAALDVPVPAVRPERSGIAVFPAGEAPQFAGEDVTDVLMAEAEAEAVPAEPGLQTAMLPTPAERPEMAALSAATGAYAPASEPSADGDAANTGLAALEGSSDGDPAGQNTGSIGESREAADEPTIEVAALERRMADPVSSRLASDEMEERLRVSVSATPLKGARPTADDAARVASAGLKPALDDSRLNERMISRWAIGRSRLSDIENPVKSPRFVDRQLRASPDMVYTTGFSAESVQADKFTGAALNFLRVTRFSQN